MAIYQRLRNGENVGACTHLWKLGVDDGGCTCTCNVTSLCKQN